MAPEQGPYRKKDSKTKENKKTRRKKSKPRPAGHAPWEKRFLSAEEITGQHFLHLARIPDRRCLRTTTYRFLNTDFAVYYLLYRQAGGLFVKYFIRFQAHYWVQESHHHLRTCEDCLQPMGENRPMPMCTHCWRTYKCSKLD